jgi:hypothetical protein
VAICERGVTNLLERYDELVAASADTAAAAPAQVARRPTPAIRTIPIAHRS